MMFISSSRIILSTPECLTIKEKRSIVKSLTSSLKNKFNVSISEIEQTNSLKEAVFALVFVSNEKKFSESVLSNVISFIDKRYPGKLEYYDLEIYAR